MNGVSGPGRMLDPRALHAASGVVGPQMFGGNMLFDRDRVAEGGTYALAAEQLGLTALRFPGGTITETMFDIRNPEAVRAIDPVTGRERSLMPLSEYLAWAGEAGLAPLLVLPTAPALLEGAHGARVPDPEYLADLRGFVRDVLAGRYGATDIHSFMIGNEYWGWGQMTAGEYGRLANEYALILQSEIDRHRARRAGDDWVEPMITVQFGQAGAWSRELPGWQQNDQIIEALTPRARAAVDAVAAHYYSIFPYAELSTTDWQFDRLDVWRRRDGLEHVAYHVTEWNIAHYNEFEQGVQYAATLLGMFATMVDRGVEAAWAWPVQQNTGSQLARDEGNRELTHMGQVFARMSERLPGAELVGLRHDLPHFGVQHYRTATTEILYVASRSDEPFTLRLDPARLGEGFTAPLTSVTATVMGYHGDPMARMPVPEFRILSELVPRRGMVEVTLAPWEIAEVVFTYGPHGVQLSGLLVDRPVAGVAYGERIAGTPHDDRLRGGSGDDTLIGGRGDDTLVGERGDNHLHGGPGDDLILGGSGDDLIHGGPGNDTIHAGAGDNILHGDGGDDLIFGGPGNDTLYGGPGDDTLFGGAGNDVINGGSGHDIAHGGPGADVFVFHRGHDSLRIMDFDPAAGDRLRLDPALWGGGRPTRDALIEAFARIGEGRELSLDFPTGDRILLSGFTDIAALADSLQFL